jgi:mono/diheme cytochrome c family protein
LKRFVIAALGAAGLIAAIGAGASRFTLGALPDPGRTETLLATKAKHYLVRRSSHSGIPVAPADRETAVQVGERLFGTECAACHGMTGRDPTDAGRWMYPRAADLTSPDTQSYSDQEIFWIVKNGIRLSGMPAFGRVESDDHIWGLVFYLRALPKRISGNVSAQSR